MKELNIENNHVVFNVEETKNFLLAEVNLEQDSNIKNTVKQISDSFNEAINETNKDKIKFFLDKIVMSENYLGEKYRDSKHQREYIKKVEEVIKYLTQYLRSINNK